MIGRAAIVAVALLTSAAPVTAESYLSFDTQHVTIFQMPNGCRRIQVMLTMTPRSNPSEWAAVVTFAHRQILKRNTFGDIEITLKRDDIANRPLVESKLAALDATAAVTGCAHQDSRITALTVAGRMLTKHDLAIRDIIDRLPDLDPNPADGRTRLKVILPRDWRLPSIESHPQKPTEPAADSRPDPLALADLDRKVTEKLATIPVR